MRERLDTSELLTLGQHCLDWLASDVGELERFMSLSGYSPDRLRELLGTTSLASGLVDYFGRNEPLLLAMCANANIEVSRLMRAWYALNPQS